MAIDESRYTPVKSIDYLVKKDFERKQVELGGIPRGAISLGNDVFVAQLDDKTGLVELTGLFRGNNDWNRSEIAVSRLNALESMGESVAVSGTYYSRNPKTGNRGIEVNSIRDQYGYRIECI